MCYVSRETPLPDRAEEVEGAVAVIILSVVVVMTIAFDHLRLVYPDGSIAKEFERQWGHHLRAKERKSASAARWFFSGMWLAMVLFTPGIAVVSMLGLILGDYSAAIVGVSAATLAKTHPLPGVERKSWEGFFGCTLTVLVLLMSAEVPFVQALIAGPSPSPSPLSLSSSKLSSIHL